MTDVCWAFWVFTLVTFFVMPAIKVPRSRTASMMSLLVKNSLLEASDPSTDPVF